MGLGPDVHCGEGKEVWVVTGNMETIGIWAVVRAEREMRMMALAEFRI